MKICIIIANYYPEISKDLLEGAIKTLKKNISTSDLGMDFINSLNPVKFNCKESFGDDTKKHYGFLAQEIKETGLSDSVTGEEGSMGMSYNDFIAPIVKALQELSSKVEALENK